MKKLENKKFDYSVIIEARMNSSRLPGKMMKKILNKPIIDYLIDRLKLIKEVDQIIIATTKNKKDNLIVNFAKKKNINFYRGSENNVLQRVVRASEKYQVKNIVSICGDNPILDPNIIADMIKFHKKYKYDCVTNSFVKSFPRGMDAVIVKQKLLQISLKYGSSKLYKEHVTLYTNHNQKKFKVKNYMSSKPTYWPELSVSLDEIADFKLIKNIIEYFVKKKIRSFGCKEIVNLLKYKKKNWIKINQKVKRKS
tara:strand:- start:841 stop:1599 length:759 start_codon:yes stop_codon:yes gene_type:complete